MLNQREFLVTAERTKAEVQPAFQYAYWTCPWAFALRPKFSLMFRQQKALRRHVEKTEWR